MCNVIVADLRFPEGGTSNLLFDQICPENCINMKESGPGGGACPWRPLDPLIHYHFEKVCGSSEESIQFVDFSGLVDLKCYLSSFTIRISSHVYLSVNLSFSLGYHQCTLGTTIISSTGVETKPGHAIMQI